MKLGVQVSIEGGIDQAVDCALGLGCNTMQVFLRNPRKFRRGSLKKEEITLFNNKREKTNISPLIIHSSYTLNLATPKKFLHWITVKEFIADLVEAEKIHADYFVVHVGCHKGTTPEKGIKRVIKALRKILKETAQLKINILLENTAGVGTSLGYTFSDYRTIFEALEFPKRLGVCLDTAHAFSAGYQIDHPEGIEKMIEEVNQAVGVERIKVIHLNDTADECGSHKDRHVHIGQGNITEKGFAYLIKHSSLRDVALILETPKNEDEDDKMNLDAVKRLYQS